MKYFFIGILMVLTSVLIYKKVPEAEFLYIEKRNLDVFYKNPKKEIASLHNFYLSEDIIEAQKWVVKYDIKKGNTIDYIFDVCALLGKFEKGKIKPSSGYNGEVFKNILNAQKQNLRIDCGQYTDFVSLFMMASNVPFRRIDAHYIPDTAIGIHSLQEIYIKEKDQWAYLDITNDKILMQHKNGDYVTAKDIYERIEKNDYSDIEIFSYLKQNDNPIPWVENIIEENKCFVPSIMLLYYTTNAVSVAHSPKMLRKRHYAFYDWVRHYNHPYPRSNTWYYARLLLLYLGIIFLLLGGIETVQKKRKKLSVK